MPLQEEVALHYIAGSFGVEREENGNRTKNKKIYMEPNSLILFSDQGKL